MRNKSLSFIASLVLLLSLVVPASIVKAKPPQCTCVEYLKAYYGITESIGNAKDTGTWLLNHGFVAVSSPQVGAIAVMQPGFTGVTDPAGHVGIIASVSTTSTNQWKITLKGANQTAGSLFSEFGCDNVRNTSWGAYSKTSTKIKYYKAYNYTIKSAANNLYFDVEGGSKSSGAYVLGWTYHGGTNQLFNFIKYGNEYRIIARNSAMCIQPQNTSQGARLVQKKCTGSNIEKWQLYSGYVLRNSQTGYVADLAGGSSNPGTWIVTWSSHGANNQKWSLAGR